MNDMMTFSIVILIPFFISIIFIPYWTRKTESFGVSIPEEIYHSQQLKEMRKQYALVITLFSVLTIIIFWLLDSFFQYDETTLAIVLSIIIGLYIVGSFPIYLVFHRKMKTLKAASDWSHKKSQLVVIDTTFRDQKLTYSNLWFIISFAIVFLTMLFTFKLYDQIPDRIPMNYSLS